MPRSIVRRLFPLLTLALSVAPSASAQGVRLPKIPSIGGTSAAVNVAPDHRMTAALLDRFEKGLDAEAASRVQQAEANKVKPTKSPEQYQQCGVAAMQTPEYRKIQSDYMASMSKGPTGDALVAAAKKYGDDLQAFLIARCGIEPGKQRESSTYEIAQNATMAGAKAAGIDNTLYAELKERIVPFCALPPGKRTGGDMQVGGSGSGKFGYLASEVAALNPRCGALAPKIRLD